MLTILLCTSKIGDAMQLLKTINQNEVRVKTKDNVGDKFRVVELSEPVLLFDSVDFLLAAAPRVLQEQYTFSSTAWLAACPL